MAAGVFTQWSLQVVHGHGLMIHSVRLSELLFLTIVLGLMQLVR